METSLEVEEKCLRVSSVKLINSVMPQVLRLCVRQGKGWWWLGLFGTGTDFLNAYQN